MIDKSNSSEPGETPEMDIATADNEQPQGKGVKRPSRNSIIFMVLIVVAVGIVLNTWGLLPFGQGTSPKSHNVQPQLRNRLHPYDL